MESLTVSQLKTSLAQTPIAESFTLRCALHDALLEDNKPREAALVKEALELLQKPYRRVKHTFREIARGIGFKGRRHFYTIADHVTTHDNYWDGGSKSDWWVWNGGSLHRLASVDPIINAQGKKIVLDNQMWVVEATIFCGKTGSLTVYASPEKMVMLLRESLARA